MAMPIIKSNSSSSLASALKINVVGVDRLMEMQLEMEEESLDKAAAAAGSGGGGGGMGERKIATFSNSAFAFTGSPKVAGGKSMKVSRASVSEPESREHKRVSSWMLLLHRASLDTRLTSSQPKPHPNTESERATDLLCKGMAKVVHGDVSWAILPRRGDHGLRHLRRRES